MAKQTINTLKNWFKTALKPTQSQFWDWLDSFWHKDDKIPMSSIDGIQDEFDKKRSNDTPIEINEVSGLEEALENAGGGAVNPTLTSDIPVNLSGGRTFGKYATGSTIPATGKTVEEVIRMAALESINPSATITASGTIVYNASAGSLTIAMTNTINNPGATVTGFVLSYRRGTGAWVQLYSGAAKASHTHDVAALLATDKTSSFSYQLIVTDSLNTSVTATSNAITPAGYAAPTTNIAVSGTRELGNISTLLSGTISQTVQNDVSITTRTLQYSLNNSTWIDITTFGINTISYTHNDAALVNSTIIYYRLSVLCSTPTGNQTTNLPLGSISFVYKNAFGYSATATGITLATLLAMGNNVLTNGKAKTVVATAPSGQYTYYAYCAAAGDLAGIIMDGVTPVIGAFTKLADITGTNSFGATVTYRVYKSNAPAAFTSNSLVIT